MQKCIQSAEKLYNHANYTLVEDLALDLEKIIKEKSDGNHMFLFGLDYNDLYGIINKNPNDILWRLFDLKNEVIKSHGLKLVLTEK